MLYSEALDRVRLQSFCYISAFLRHISPLIFHTYRNKPEMKQQVYWLHLIFRVIVKTVHLVYLYSN